MYPILLFRALVSYSFTFIPSTSTSPSVTSYNLGTRFIKVDLPLPVLPIKAMVSPFFTLKLIFFFFYSLASGYLKLTFLNSTVPVSLVSPLNVPGFIEISSSNTSFIRLADT